MDELRAALDLATDEELQALTEILFRRKFNPLDYVYTPEPIDIQSQERHDWIASIEERFRYLAADGMTVLRGQAKHITYRQVLLRVCRYLKIPCTHTLSAEELEAEIFLHLLHRAWMQLPKAEQASLSNQLQQVLRESELARHLPRALHNDPTSLFMKGGSALAISSVIRPLVLQLIARQFAIHAATYEVAKQAAVKSGAALVGHLQNEVAMRTAYRGMMLSAARYSTVRGLFALLGPAMWAWFFADLGWRTIATNYGRVIPVIFTLAQIRLTRGECFELA